MRLIRLTVQNVRSHARKEVGFSDDSTTVIGPNGSGKTSILEAVSVCLSGSSFRGVDREIVSYDEMWYRIDLETDEYVRTVKYVDGKKIIIIDDKSYMRLPVQHRYPIVLFEPDDLRLLSGSPSRRRRFLDIGISQIDSIYKTTLRKYERALKQRNSLLKRGSVHPDDLFVWNVSLAEYGEYIHMARRQYIDRLNQHVEGLYCSMCGVNDSVTFQYSEYEKDITKATLLHRLEQAYTYDSVTRTTSVGPHRSDFVGIFNGHPIAKHASRGELRSVGLVLKAIEARIAEEVLGKRPIILLDDVYGELDDERQQRIRHIYEGFQLIMTSTSSIQGAATKVVRL